MEEQRYTLKEAAKLALDIQNACNLSGVARSFGKVMLTIWDEARRIEKGTDWVNTHPIAILFVSKLSDLSRYAYGDQVDNVSKALRECEQLAGVPYGSS